MLGFMATDANVDANAAVPGPTLEVPTGILTFRTEQIYICDADERVPADLIHEIAARWIGSRRRMTRWTTTSAG